MKLIIAGGRDYVLTDMHWAWLDDVRLGLMLSDPISEVVSGRCTGADTGGEEWARSRGITVTPFPADWRPGGILDKRAGPRRNQLMIHYAGGLAVFPGNDGTADVLRRAKRAGLMIWSYVPEEM